MCSENHMHKNDAVAKAMNALRDTPIPSGPPTQIAAATLAAVLESAKEPQTLTIIERIRTMKRITKFAAAAAIIIVIISLITWFTPGDPVNGGVELISFPFEIRTITAHLGVLLHKKNLLS